MPSRPEPPWYARVAAVVGALAALAQLALGGYLLYKLVALFLGWGTGGGAQELLGFLGALLLLAPASLFLVLGWAGLFAAWSTMRGSRAARLGLAATLLASAVLAGKSRLPHDATLAAAAVLVACALASLIAYRA